MPTVVIFGPTGNVGSVTARTAHDLGANVLLAMRDPTKPVPGLSAEEERASDRYTRLPPTDLSDAASVKASLATVTGGSGIDRAFIYFVLTADYMRSSIAALRAAGVRQVVFLSSWTVAGRPVRSVPADEMIAHNHAGIEASLEEVFGSADSGAEVGYVAVRAGYFATNLLPAARKALAGDGVVPVYRPTEAKVDLVTTADLGLVSGTVLAKGTAELGQRKAVWFYLYGPQLVTFEEAFKAIGKAAGKELTVKAVGAQEIIDFNVSNGFPPPIAAQMVSLTDYIAEKGFPEHQAGTESVKLYGEKPGMTLAQWVEANKGRFTNA